MFSQQYLQFYKLRERELRAQAERHQLVREALAGRSSARTSIYGPLLARIGTGMVQFGSGLQTRYGQMQPTSSGPRPQLKQA